MASAHASRRACAPGVFFEKYPETRVSRTVARTRARVTSKLGFEHAMVPDCCDTGHGFDFEHGFEREQKENLVMNLVLNLVLSSVS